MGSFCGWGGRCAGSDMSRQALEEMLPAGTAPADACYQYGDNGALATVQGLYPTAITSHQDFKAAVLGSPQWDDAGLARTAREEGQAAAVLSAFRTHGKDFLRRLHGPFALAVTGPDRALVAIDRLGIHSLSYSLGADSLVFSTSTASVARHPSINTAIRPQSIFNYFYFYDIPSPGTVYEGIDKLLPAQYVELRDGRMHSGFYWEMPFDEQRRMSFGTTKQEFRKLLEDAVTSASRDRDVACFLSGGTDSSTITGILSGLSESPVDTYSIGFGAEGFDEMEYARIAVERFSANPHEYYLQPDDVLEAIPLIAEIYDEPFANESAVPTYFCAKQAARDGFSVMLAGDGGDEIFAGNERYAKQKIFEHWGRLPGCMRQTLIEPLIDNFPFGDALLPVRKLRSYVHQASIPMPQRMDFYSLINRQPLEDMFEPGFLSGIDSGLPAEMMKDAYLRANSESMLNRMLHLDLKFTLADNDLRKVSRMCEAAGVEVRYPLLDESLVEFSARLPLNYKLRGNQLRWFFKKALEDLLPPQIVTKSKHGFGLPFGVWALSHAPIKELVDTTLDRFNQRGILRTGYIEDIRRRHEREHSTYYGKMIWIMLMLELWMEKHPVGNQNG